jgi:hypothetical protein
LFSGKTLQSNLSWLHKAFSSSTIFKERLLKDRSSFTLESELEASSRTRGVFTREVEVIQGSTRLGHDLLELLLFLASEAILLLVVTLIVVVVLVDVVLLVGGVKLLPLGIDSDEVGGIAALKLAIG